MQRRLFVALVVVVLIAVAITGSLIMSLLRINYIKDLEDKLLTNSKLIRHFIIEEEEKISFNDMAINYAKDINARITFINDRGYVIGDSHIDIKKLENHANRQEIKEALNGKIGIAKRYSQSLNKEMYYVALPYNNTDREISVIRLSVPTADVSKYYTDSIIYIFISLGFGTAVAIFLGYRYVYSITKPIKELTLATESIANGKYGQEVHYKSNDEIGVLANSFNIMSKKLYENIEELEENSMKTKAILTSMINGIIAINNIGNVIFINQAAENMFKVTEREVRNKHILETLKNEGLNNKIKELLKSNTASKLEIELVNPYRVLLVYTNYIVLDNNPTRKIGVVISFQDITEIRKLETMRKDFVANVSHELKTPLTSIQGFIETLKDSNIKDERVKRRFLGIIDIEAKRLTALVQDLLILSDIENKHQMISKQDIDVRECILDLIDIFEKRADKKAILITEKISGRLPSIYGNLSWFKEMFINLIDNSVKYTPNGGKIEIIGYEIDGNVHIKIKDSGIGISKEHIPRLFERFYRVDKARSRKIGGTGLGLAIVKHIVIAFKGEIKVKSKLNKGTEFEVIIPTYENNVNKG
ncbi:ATP-binding protein [Clostridiaceae bacterium M8S5]|nr:ATP-binding protein [Clostridiaceae bacterium M8S5]